VPVPPGLACGGQLLAHVADRRQRALAGELIADALRRIGKLAIDAPIAVSGGAADGYRTRARIHARAGRVGFFAEGTHRLCDLTESRQLTTESVATIERLTEALVAAAPGLEAEIEWVEDVRGTTRIAHLTVARVADARALSGLAAVAGLDGLSCSVGADVRESGRHLWGAARVADRLAGPGGAVVTVMHGARAFFQGNRYLLQPLVEDVAARLDGPVLDLYAGVGLFTLAAAAAGHPVTAVEGDPASSADLIHNVDGLAGVVAVPGAVETHLAGPRHRVGTVVLDPPRTGLSVEALSGVLTWAPPRIVYVSCDPATLARDLRRCLDAGYGLGAVRGFDLFPRTGHVEAVVTLTR
jgi:23S rRNA (uracil1939-C5)-methyltransferase